LDGVSVANIDYVRLDGARSFLELLQRSRVDVRRHDACGFGSEGQRARSANALTGCGEHSAFAS
jgi:hypothetical protein